MGLTLLLALLNLAEPPLWVRPTENSTRIEVLATLPVTVADSLPVGAVGASRGEGLLRLALFDRETGREGPAILGSYERRGTTLAFRPRFGLIAGQRYRATLALPAGKPVSMDHVVPARPAEPAARVEKIYPTGDELPANLLKFYLHFSRPMRQGRDIFELIELRTEKGEPVVAPWRRTELWSDDGKRLTLWIHPGRVKEGVNLRVDLGPVLEPGRRYTLVVGADLLDADGRPLGKEFRKVFRVTEPLRARPLPQEWTLRPPPAGARDILFVTFRHAMDRALLDRFLTVIDAEGRPVAGRTRIGDGERWWSFEPARPWKEATYTLKVDDRLEDVAGNTPARLFDTDLEAPALLAPRLSRSIRLLK